MLQLPGTVSMAPSPAPPINLISNSSAGCVVSAAMCLCRGQRKVVRSVTPIWGDETGWRPQPATTRDHVTEGNAAALRGAAMRVAGEAPLIAPPRCEKPYLVIRGLVLARSSGRLRE